MKKIKIILNPPIQLRETPSFGAIYSGILSDFYTKCLRESDIEAILIINDNVVGKKTEKLLGSIPPELVTKKIEQFVLERRVFQDSFGITPFIQIRDDEISQKTIDSIFLKKQIKSNFISLRYCHQCSDHYGSDPSLIICSTCGSALTAKMINHYNSSVHIKRIKKDASKAFFFPKGMQKKFTSLLENFPEKHKISFEKNRGITFFYKNRSLDPKFVTLASLVHAIDQTGFDDFDICIFQGDILKKFTYLIYALLPKEYHPKMIASHGLILNNVGQKLRNEDIQWINNLENKKTLRAFLLSFNIGSNIKMDQNSFEQKEIGLIRLYKKIKTMINYPSYEGNDVAHLKKDFLQKVESMHFGLCSQMLSKIVNFYWEKTRNDKRISIQERQWLLFLGELYFIDIM